MAGGASSDQSAQGCSALREQICKSRDIGRAGHTYLGQRSHEPGYARRWGACISPGPDPQLQ